MTGHGNINLYTHEHSYLGDSHARMPGAPCGSWR
jgi:hypothetical protein